jgi:hypothetical protein
MNKGGQLITDPDSATAWKLGIVANGKNLLSNTVGGKSLKVIKY